MTDSLSQAHVMITATKHIVIPTGELRDYQVLLIALTATTDTTIQIYQVSLNQSSAVCSGNVTGFLCQIQSGRYILLLYGVKFFYQPTSRQLHRLQEWVTTLYQKLPTLIQSIQIVCKLNTLLT